MAFDIQFKLIYQGIRDVFRVRSLSNLSESSRNKLYVALTRSSGDVYIMSSQQFAREVSK